MSGFLDRLRLVLAPAVLLAAGGVCQAETGLGLAAESCGEFGTAVSFAESPAEAARLARLDEKLVFVLHVSGHFETPEFT